MRLSKVESLRKDIEVISQNHERDVDRKDAIIQVLLIRMAKTCDHALNHVCVPDA